VNEPALHPLTQRILNDQAPEPLRRAAARGAVPVPLGELIRIQVHLALAGEAEISAAAAGSLREIEPSEVETVVTTTGCPLEVLDWFARHRNDDPEIVTAVFSNAETPEDALVAAAGSSREEVLDRILDNQMRLLDSPGLVEALDGNPAVTGTARTRLHDLKTELARRARVEAERQARPVPEPEESPVADGKGAGAAEAVGDEPAADAVLTGEVEDAVVAPVEEVPADDDQEAIVRIMNMSVPDKIALAMKGNKEERGILVRDTIKVVSLAVMKSPRLSESEVESIAGMRNVVEDVIRVVASNREWLRNYAVVCALCKNPKTPVTKTLILMSRLNNRDLKMLGSDRNIPEVVRVNARRTFVARTAPAAVSYKKK
jgi:hypothetical protein